MLDFIESQNIPYLFAGLGIGVACGFVGRVAVSRVFGTNKILTTAMETVIRESKDSQYKMVLVVRNDLKMGKGKACAQCSHASVSVCLFVSIFGKVFSYR